LNSIKVFKYTSESRRGIARKSRDYNSSRNIGNSRNIDNNRICSCIRDFGDAGKNVETTAKRRWQQQASINSRDASYSWDSGNSKESRNSRKLTKK